METHLDTSRKVFVNEKCFKENMGSEVLEKLAKLGFPRKNIIEWLDLDLLRNGDYKVRCIGGSAILFEVEFQKENVFLKQVARL